jgi:hypothetical protein
MSDNENETGELLDSIHPGDVLREDFLSRLRLRPTSYIRRVSGS